MRSKNSFSSEEIASIGIAKDKLMEVSPLKRYLERLTDAKKQIWLKMEDSAYRAPSFNWFFSDRQNYSSGLPNNNMCRLLDKSKRIDEEITAVQKKWDKIVYTINKMPTEKLRGILIKKYVFKTKTMPKDRNLRYRYLADAYLEFFHTYCN